MQGRHSLGGDLKLAAIKIINQIRRIRENLRRLPEDNNLVPMEIEDVTDQTNQAMIASGARQLVMKEYARPIISTAVLCILLGDAARNCELKNVHFTMLPSFYGMPNEDPLSSYGISMQHCILFCCKVL